MPTVAVSDFQQLVKDPATRWISLLMPTHRSGPQTHAGSTRLTNLIKEAEKQAEGLGDDDLAEARALAASSQFWQHQLDGLAVFIGLTEGQPATTYSYRVPIDLPERVVVSQAPHLQPLAPMLAGDELYYVLVLSQQSARLFEATRRSMDEVDPGSIPTSIDDLHEDRDHQAHLNFTSQGGGDVSFHGHGGDSQIDQVQRDKYFRAVAAGLSERLSGQDQPLVLATVEDNAVAFREVCDYPHLAQQIIPGSAEHMSAPQLLEAAAPVGSALLDARGQSYAQRLDQMIGQDRVSRDRGNIVRHATDGRVDTLFIAPDREHAGQPDTLVDQAIMATWANGGEVAESPAQMEDELAAILRY